MWQNANNGWSLGLTAPPQFSESLNYFQNKVIKNKSALGKTIS